ncbi:MAG: prolyl oligopeptidase family serine peptidase [Luteitalea sp.]|nr:prolyl oligopeptidase family serine peptidase [Luteitalea sp.]
MKRTTGSGLVLVVLTLLALSSAQPAAEREGFALEQVLGFTFPSDLTASRSGSRVAWALLQRGVRSLWVADGQKFEPRRLFASNGEDGQELTNLTFSADGHYLVYVRGGDHGSNWTAEGNLMPNPTSSPVEPKMQVWSVSVDGGTPKLIGEGDEPVPAPQGNRVLFKRGRALWITLVDGSARATPLFFARGSSESPEWSPDGKTVAFVSDRRDLSYIGLYTSAEEPLRYIAPSTSRDSMPRWSPDGTRVAFVRQPGRGGSSHPPLEAEPQPWAIWVADVKTGDAREVWRSPETLRGSYPRVAGGANLLWGADDRLAFLAYHDGWPHLYTVPTTGERAEARLLTPGTFMVEHVELTPDRRSLIYSANTGADEHDSERRHLFMVPLEGGNPTALTSGTGLEWSPRVTGDGELLTYLASTAEQPPLPVVRTLRGDTEPRTLLADQLPADFPADALVTPEDVVITAPDGTSVHAQLFKQPNGAAARRPAIVFAHGGPARQMLLGWHYMFYYANTYAMNQYLASRGYIVLSVNYRLGIGYGFEFHHPPRAGVRGASEYQDVLAAGRYLQQRSDVDAARIGIWGGSYGGYLTALGLARNSDVFAAGADLHGVHTRLQLAPTAQQAAALAGDGLSRADLDEAAKVAWESAPAAHVKTWRSPVLLVHGDDDRNVRVEQTVDLVQRLRAANVPFDEIIIPDDIHDFLLYRNWLRVYRAVAEFFDRHLTTSSPTSR